MLAEFLVWILVPEKIMDFSEKINVVNERLKAANVAVKIQQKNSRLCLRATLPPKPNSSATEAYQQRIYVGYHANPTGLRTAEAKAKEIGALLDQGHFNWEPYLKSPIVESRLIDDLIKDLEVDYFETRKRSPETLTTWKGDYIKVFNKLPQDKPITEEILRSLILTTQPNTRTRRRFVLALAKLADFAKIDHDLRRLIGEYSPRRVNPRDVPDDSLIQEIYRAIVNPSWQCVYALMAIYGLRNYEVFKLDLSEFPIIFVHKGKTDEERYVYPLYPEWLDWLSNIDLPTVTGKNNSDLGNRVTHAFKRLGVPFAPYNLRHAWARRSLEFGYDPILAAGQMGHSVQVHTQVYHHWLSKDVYRRAYENLMKRDDRPVPPGNT